MTHSSSVQHIESAGGLLRPRRHHAHVIRTAPAYTPKHGSWLNMAEIGLLVRGCLDRRIGSETEFRNEIGAYLERKNENPQPIKWQFTNEKARVKLKSLYPAV